jgi:hypothetical protein
MKIVRSFSAPVSEINVRERAVFFLSQSGYRQQSYSSGYLHFKRGSDIGALSNFNPCRWACNIFVRIKSEGNLSEINIEAEISTDPTEKRFAEELLTAEFNLLEAAITLNEFKTYDASVLKKKIAAHVYHVVGVFTSFMFAVILGIVGGLFAYVELDISLFGASAIGVVILLLIAAIFLMLWRKQKKTSR